MSTFRNQPPSDAYDGCDTPEAIDARYKELYWAEADVLGVRHLPIDVHDKLMEDHRRAWCRYIEVRDRSTAPDGSTRVRRSGTAVVAVEVAGDTMTCAGACGEELPVKKFPTISGKPGVRRDTCRACLKAGAA